MIFVEKRKKNSTFDYINDSKLPFKLVYNEENLHIDIVNLSYNCGDFLS